MKFYNFHEYLGTSRSFARAAKLSAKKTQKLFKGIHHAVARLWEHDDSANPHHNRHIPSLPTKVCELIIFVPEENIWPGRFALWSHMFLLHYTHALSHAEWCDGGDRYWRGPREH